MKISKLIRKALEYDNNGDPLSDVISGDAEWADVLEYTVSLEERIQQLRRALDNIKIRAYELGQPELHDMALAALKENDNG